MGLARGWVVRALVLLPLWGCGVGRGGDEGRAARHLSLTCNPAWNPAWSQGGSAGPWWVEYAIGGGKGKVVSAWLEASDQQLLLTEQWGKWSASPPRKLEAGTPIVVHALNDRYQTASTYAFGYLAEAAPLTDPCGGQCVPRCGANLCGDDGCGGSCGLCPEGTACEAGSCVEYIAPQRVCSGGECTCIAPWNPFWQQVNANDYWVEYTVSRGTVKSVWLEVVGGDRTDLKLEWGRWVGAPRTAIAAGTPVVLHARDDARHSAQTAPFGYLTTPVASTDACRGSGPAPTCAELARGMVTVSFDDGLDAQYTLARPLLLQHHLQVTLYFISDALAEGWPGYLTLPHARRLLDDGHELASHTATHPDLATESGPAIDDELERSKTWLEAAFGRPVDDFATPYGSFNDAVVASARRHYQSHTTVDTGLNFPGDDLYRLKRYTVTADTTPAQIAGWVEQAKRAHGWAILLFHDFTRGAPTDPYGYAISDFQKVLDDLDQSGVEVVSIAEGTARLRCP